VQDISGPPPCDDLGVEPTDLEARRRAKELLSRPAPATYGANDMEFPATPQQWERLKRLTYLLDAAPGLDRPGLSEPDAAGIRYMRSAESSPELDKLHELVYDMGLVSQWFTASTPDPPADDVLFGLDLFDTCVELTRIFRGDRFVEGLLVSRVNEGVVQRLCRRAYSIVNTTDGWPKSLAPTSGGRLPMGMVFRSLSGEIEGRTTGGRRECPADGCPGWLVSVLWETGQLLHICSEGWHHDPETGELRVVGGGEISARFVSPPPLGEPPRPRSEWPTRAELSKRKAWSAVAR